MNTKFLVGAAKHESTENAYFSGRNESCPFDQAYNFGNFYLGINLIRSDI